MRTRAVRRRACALVAALSTAAVLAGCDGSDGPGPAQPSVSIPITPVTLTFGVWGAPDEIAAYQSVVDVYNTLTDEAQVKVQPYSSHQELTTALDKGLDKGKVPDVFLVSRGDLSVLRDKKLNQPIGDLLDERGVDFGDGYSRAALEAFADDRQLQCMPYGISPMVIYYNRALVDFDQMAERGLNVPTVNDSAGNPRPNPTWTFEQFQAAAEFATRPRKGVTGFYVAPTLRGLAPYIYSGGGELFDDDEDPTSLAFSSDDTRSALEKVLPLLRDPKLTLTADQLAEKSALQWFKDGKLGMIAGFRDLVPELRQTSTLDFDVMPMPVVDDPATIGDITGICISRDSPDVSESADFLVNFISSDSVAKVVRVGYLSPANTTVALSDDFLQPGRAPDHATVFNASVKAMKIPPLLDSYDALESAVADPLRELLEVAVPDLDELTQRIDDASLPVLSPEDASQSPSEDSSD